MNILNAQGGPYFDGIDVSRPVEGEWFNVDVEVLSASFETLLASAISGDVYFEFTADPSRAKGISRVVLPDGCLHTTASGVTLPSARTTINLASAASLAKFTVSVSAVMIGSMRCCWTWGSGGGANPKLYGHIQASRGEG